MKSNALVSLLCLAFLFVLSAPAAEDFSDGLLDRESALAGAAAITAEAYPNADSVLVDEHVRVRYQADGTSDTWDDEYIKILTEKGKRNQQTISLYFTLPYGTAEVKKLEVIKPDGTVAAVDIERQSRVMVDREQMSANIYNPNDKILQISVPGLELGDVCHIVSHHTTVKPRVPDTWSDYTLFESTLPIQHLVYEVFGPKERPLCNIKLRDELPGTVAYTSDGSDTGNHYRWEVRDVPRMFAEPKMPPLYAVVQRLLVSTIPDWKDISRWYWELSKPHLDATVPEMTNKVSELIEGVTGQQEQTERIFKFVSQQIRYMGITTETEAPGYEPHDTKLTFENRYGVCRDKAALLVTLLRMADIPAYPVLIHTGVKKDEEVPQPYFNHAIVATEDGAGGYILMDPTDENTVELLPAYLGDKSYLVAHPEGERLLTSPVDPATKNLMRVHSTGAIDANGTLRMRSTLRFDGINDNGYRGYFSQLKPIERRQYFEGRIKRRIAGARITEFEIVPADMQDTGTPLEVRFSYEAQDYPLEGDPYAMLSLPWLGTSIGYVNFVLGQTGLAQRKYPFLTRIACGVEETFDMALGSGLGAIVSLPDYTPIETNALSFVPRLSIESNVLHGADTFLLKAIEFTPTEYLVLKQALKEIEYAQRKQPVFAAAPLASEENDILIVRDDLSLSLNDACNWTRTRSIKKKILTYAGKKQHSELKFNYNPVWTDVEIEEAKVTNPDGTVRHVVAEEQNIMDAQWVGSAPRYPAEKTMVVSLPGVEIGSLIEYRVTQRMRNWPFFSISHSFRGFEPSEASSLRVSAPAGLPLKVKDHTGGTIAYRVCEQDGRVVHEWTSAAQPAITQEDALPPLESFTPTVLVSAGAWTTYAGALQSRLTEATREQSATREAARGLVAGLHDDTAKVLAIRDYLARAVRPAGPNLDELPFAAITPTDRVLTEGYGYTADRAAVLYVMLEEAGLSPHFLLASSWAPRIAALQANLFEIPQQALFDEMLVNILLDGTTVTLNDSDQYGALGATPSDGRPALTMQGEPSQVAAAPGMRRQGEEDCRIDLSENGDALITFTTRYYGTDYAAFKKRFSELPPEERKRHFLEMVADVSQAAEARGELVTEYAEYPGRQSFTVQVPRFAVRAGNYMYLALPHGAPGLLPVTTDNRKNPLYVSRDVVAAAHYEIHLPANAARVELLPKPMEWNGPAGLGTFVRTSALRTTDTGALVADVMHNVNLSDTVVPAEDYPALLDADRRIKHPAGYTLLISLN